MEQATDIPAPAGDPAAAASPILPSNAAAAIASTADSRATGSASAPVSDQSATGSAASALDADAPPGRGRPQVLDDDKRRKVLAIVSNGSSRRFAAQYVGCAPSTITRTAARDPVFAAELAQAERNAEIEALRYLRAAMRKDRYWRAAAWYLERKNPFEFAPHASNVLTFPQAAEILGQLLFEATGDMPDDEVDRYMARLHELGDIVQRDGHLPPRPFVPLWDEPLAHEAIDNDSDADDDEAVEPAADSTDGDVYSSM